MALQLISELPQATSNCGLHFPPPCVICYLLHAPNGRHCGVMRRGIGGVLPADVLNLQYADRYLVYAGSAVGVQLSALSGRETLPAS